jgi:hypothetical protein
MLIWKYTWMFSLLPFILGTVYFHKLSISHRFVYFYVVTGVVTEIISQYLRNFTEIKNNMPLGHIYISLSFILIAIFYFHQLKGFINKKAIVGIIISFEIFSFINLIFFQSYYDYPSTTGATSALILVVFSILLFSKIMTEGKIKVLSKSSIIWINTAILINYAGNFFFYILFNLMLEHAREYISSTLNFFKILYILFYILLAVGFWKEGTKQISQ